ncbi:hypothetical protein [Methanooceanicella nereidis]|nr:hypothetical protein [Methanocella sp. CWC-04]
MLPKKFACGLKDILGYNALKIRQKQNDDHSKKQNKKKKEKMGLG